MLTICSISISETSFHRPRKHIILWFYLNSQSLFFYCLITLFFPNRKNRKYWNISSAQRNSVLIYQCRDIDLRNLLWFFSIFASTFLLICSTASTSRKSDWIFLQSPKELWWRSNSSKDWDSIKIKSVT